MSTGRKTSSISIVIPTLNEEALIGSTLTSLQGIPGVEIIVADGGSHDRTTVLAGIHGGRVIAVSGGRAAQMNAGAEAASGDILLFLHADTILPPRFANHVRNVLSRKDVVAGAFRLAVDAPGAAVRLIETFANLRARLFSLPYGDQAIFLEASLFHAIGGFPDLSLMEDFALVRALRQRGRIVILPEAAVTSGRRWQRLGILRTTCLNQFIVVAYLFGVSPARLAGWYRKGQKR